jgi:predicted AAA+ superfamily ATPase
MAYVKTYLEQDIPNLGLHIPAPKLRRFWMMLTHYNAQIFNASEMARSLEMSAPTVRSYLDILTNTFMVRALQPWFENISKRQVKSPKIYWRDTGLLHALLGLQDMTGLLNHPKLGASWESFALEQVIRRMDVDPHDCYFWATHAQAELDLLVHHRGKRLGFEFKYSRSPSLTKSMHIARETLRLDQLFVIVPGAIDDFLLADNVQVCGLSSPLLG